MFTATNKEPDKLRYDTGYYTNSPGYRKVRDGANKQKERVSRAGEVYKRVRHLLHSMMLDAILLQVYVVYSIPTNGTSHGGIYSSEKHKT